jgi:hypothetical protein
MKLDCEMELIMNGEEKGWVKEDSKSRPIVRYNTIIRKGELRKIKKVNIP